MRILFVAPRYHSNQHPLVTGLQAHGHEVRFLVQYRGGSEEYGALAPDLLKHAPIFRTIYRLTRGHELALHNPVVDLDFVRDYGIPAWGPLYSYLKAADPDIVITRDLLPTMLWVVMATKRLGKPVLFYNQVPLHGVNSRSWNLWYRLYRILFREAMVEITPVLGDVNKAGCRNPHRYYLPFVAPTVASSAPRLQPVPAGAPHPIRILAIGKFVPRKNHLLMTQAVEALRTSCPLHLTLIGENTRPAHQINLDEVRRYVQEAHLENLVTIRTNLSYGEVQQAYREHDLFVLPSSNEAASISLLEAMAHGLPVICSDTNGTRCYIEPEKNGLIFRSGQLGDLTAKVAAIIADRARMIEMGEHSRNLAQTVHSPAAFHTAFTAITRTHFNLG